MYSTLKKFSIALLLLGSIHMAAAFLCAMYMTELSELPVTAEVSLIAFFLLSGIISLIIGICLRDLQEELAIHTDSIYEDITQLKKRVDDLEV